MGRGAAPKSYDTKLTPQEEREYRAWAKRAGRENDTVDYDLRGAWKAGAAQSENGHLPDTFKKPNHPTFSVESQYAKGFKPGRWIVENGRDVFIAGEDNLRNMPLSKLKKYFEEVEPGVELRPPPPRSDKFYKKPD